MFVRSWMSTPVVVLPASTPASDALEYMEVQKIRRVPIVREGLLVGIITRSDLQTVLAPEQRAGRRSPAVLGDIMTRSVITVSPDDTLERASQAMLRHEISGLPVMDGDQLVGIITESDIFAAFNEIMGTSESGARLVMSVPANADLLESVRRRISGLTARSLAAYRRPSGAWEVVVRVCGRAPAPVR